MSDEAFDLNSKSLDGLLKVLKGDMKRVRVGILGGKTTRNDAPVDGGSSINATKKSGAPKTNFEVSTNAAVGAIHEFGTDKMPMRSFLRVPIAENLQKRLESSGAFGPDELARVVKETSFLPWLQRIGAVAERIVSDAFDTGGFGKWPKWKTKGYTSNTGQVLVDTQQLRNSITSDVK